MTQRRYYVMDLLEQREVWQAADDDPKLLTELQDDHLVNLKGWLLRNATKLLRSHISSAYSFASTLNGEMAQDAMDVEIDRLEEMNPHVWMEDRPLFQAIDAEIDRRRGYVVCHIIEE